jgi:hypothetical protein
VAEHLVELVRDEDDGGAGGDELAQRGEQLVDLLGHEHGGGLVEDQDAGAAVEHLEDLAPLLLADAELGHEGVGVDLEAVALTELDQLAAGALDVEPEPAVAWFLAEHDVLPHGEVVGQHEVLEHHADAVGDGVLRRLEVAFLTVDLDGALVGLVRAVEGLHQRRLAGAVLADDRVDGARTHRQVDPVVGHHAGEPLDDVAQLDGERCAGDVRRVVHRECSSRWSAR